MKRLKTIVRTFTFAASALAAIQSSADSASKRFDDVVTGIKACSDPRDARCVGEQLVEGMRILQSTGSAGIGAGTVAKVFILQVGAANFCSFHSAPSPKYLKENYSSQLVILSSSGISRQSLLQQCVEGMASRGFGGGFHFGYFRQESGSGETENMHCYYGGNGMSNEQKCQQIIASEF